MLTINGSGAMKVTSTSKEYLGPRFGDMKLVSKYSLKDNH
jgi:hypothetical protein